MQLLISNFFVWEFNNEVFDKFEQKFSLHFFFPVLQEFQCEIAFVRIEL